MLRRVIVVALAITLTFLLVAAAGFVELRFMAIGPPVLDMASRGREAITTKEQAEAFFELLGASLLRSRVLYRPLTSLLIGLLVGSLAGRARWLLAIALMPFLVFVWHQESWDWLGLGLALVYFAVAWLGLEAGVRWRGRREAPQVTRRPLGGPASQ